MTSKESVNIIDKLNSSSLPEQVAQLRTAAASNQPTKATITEAILTAARDGAISPRAASLWVTVANDLHCTLACLRQQDSVCLQRTAIREFSRRLRKDATFDQTWAGIGGTSGLITVLSSLSVKNVHYMCKSLARYPGAGSAWRKRRVAMSELLAELYPILKIQAGSSDTRADDRPLKSAYQLLVPACDPETALAWEGTLGTRLQLRVWESHGRNLSTETTARYESVLAKSGCDANYLAAFVHNSVEFGLFVLDTFSKRQTLDWTAQIVVIETMTSLLKRYHRRSMDGESTLALWRLAMQCFSKHVCLQDQADRFFIFAVKDWARFNGTAIFENVLVDLIQLIPKSFAQASFAEQLVRAAPPKRRYSILRLFLQHAKDLQLDIGQGIETSLIRTSEKLRLSPGTFLLLRPQEAWNLLDRLMKSDPSLEFLQTRLGQGFESVLKLGKGPLDSGVDIHILQALLIKAMGNTQKTSGLDLDHFPPVDELFRRKKLATKERSASKRAFWVKSCLFLATSTGDIDILMDVVAWTDRFAKDPLVLGEILSNYTLSTNENLDLLSALPANPPNTKHNYTQTMHHLSKANQIFLLFIKKAILSASEPDFNLAGRQFTFILGGLLTQERLARVNAWQDDLGLSDDAVFQVLWEPTIQTLIEAERLALGSNNKALDGCAQSLFNLGSIGNLRQPAVRFLDVLSERRDRLWTDFRQLSILSDTTVNMPCPTGLPIQSLVQFSAKAPFTFKYVEARAEKIIFGDVETYLSPCKMDDGSKMAVGRFVDSWVEALNIYIRGCIGDERKARIVRAWSYATVELSKHRMSAVQASMFWAQHFKSAGVLAHEIKECDDTPLPNFPKLLPQTSPTDQSSWNPDAGIASLLESVESQDLEPTYLDIMLNPSTSPFRRNLSAASLPQPISYWQLVERQGRELPSYAVDYFIYAAILVLNESYGADKSMTPPDVQSKRFPFVSLDPNYLEYGLLGMDDAKRLLQHFILDIPIQLLLDLASSIFKKLLDGTSTDAPHSGEFAFVVRLLSGSDRPAAACGLVQASVLELHEHSGWHRLIFNEGFLRSLTPDQGKDMIASLTMGFFGDHQSTAPEDPLNVKITTIKALAQALQGVCVTSPRFSIDMLCQVLDRTSHIDAHVAALDSIVSTAAAAQDPEVDRLAIQALHRYGIPRASSLNEWNPTSEEEWRIAEEGGPLPEVWEPRHSFPPMLELFIRASSKKRSMSEKFQKEISRALSEVLERSMKVHKRWLQLFLQRHEFPLSDTAILPLLPVQGSVIKRIFEEAGLVTIDLFRSMASYLLMSLEPGTSVARITSHIKDDRQLRESNSGRHWLSLWGMGETTYYELGGLWACANLSSTPSVLKLADGTNLLENLVWEMSKIFLKKGDVDSLNAMVETLVQNKRAAPESVDSGRVETVLYKIIDHIDQLRTREWQVDPKRHPRFLPNTFRIKLQILLSRCVQGDEAMSTEDMLRIASDTVKLMIDLTHDPMPYHDNYQIMKDVLGDEFGMHIGIAVSIGTPEVVTESNAVPELVAYLRVDFASHILGTTSLSYGVMGPWDAETIEAVKSMLRSWDDSVVEYFRNRAQLFSLE